LICLGFSWIFYEINHPATKGIPHFLSPRSTWFTQATSLARPSHGSAHQRSDAAGHVGDAAAGKIHEALPGLPGPGEKLEKAI
jgi:hypothetical protein